MIFVHNTCENIKPVLLFVNTRLNQLAEDLGKRQCAQAIIWENKWTKWEDIFPWLEFNNPFPLFSDPELNESLHTLSSTLPLRTVYNLAKDENEQNLFKAAPLLGSNMDVRTFVWSIKILKKILIHGWVALVKETLSERGLVLCKEM